MQNCHLFLEAKSRKQFRFPFQLQKTTKKLSILCGHYLKMGKNQNFFQENLEKLLYYTTSLFFIPLDST